MRRFHAAQPLLAVLFLASSAWAGHRTTGSVHVHGYTTRSGHYVAPYTRSAPPAGHLLRGWRRRAGLTQEGLGRS